MDVRQKLLRKLKDDAILFGKAVNPNAFSVKTPKFHYELRDFYHSDSKRIVIQAPRGHAKQLADSTPILTTKGWKTHGDLKPGDYVYHPSGKPTKVIATNSKTPSDWAMELKNGEKIRCSWEHEWVVFDRNKKKYVTLETWELEGDWSESRSRYLLPNREALQYPKRGLPIDPYWFGLWLGDGSSSAPRITYEKKDKEWLTHIPYRPTVIHEHKDTGVLSADFTHQGLRESLKALNVFRNKHIPEIYLTAGKEQRLRLLAGLIDSDGYLDRKRGRVKFINTNKRLAEDVYRLMFELGMNPYISKQKPTPDYKNNIISKLDVYQVGGNPIDNIPTRISRKRTGALRKRPRVGILRVYRDPNGEVGNCIQVEADDGLYLAGRKLIPTHNSTLVGGIFALHHLLFENKVQNKFILLISKTEGHAKRLLQTIGDILEFSPTFRQLFGYWGRQSAKKWAEREIILKDGSIIMAKGMGQQIVGLKHLNQRPTFVVLDDPEDLNNTKTPEAMEHNLTVLLKEIIPALDARIGRVFVIGTPQRQGCMVEKLMDMPGWVSKRYDAIVDEKSKLTLWPELHTWEKLMEEKRALESIGRLSIFYSEWRCMLIGDEEQLFKPEYIKYWDGDLIHENGEAFLVIQKKGYNISQGFDYAPEMQEFKDPIKTPVNVFMGIDPASSIKKTADFSVIMPIAVDEEKNIYILPYFHKRVTPMQLATNIIEFFKKYKPKWTNIETVGYQEMLRDYLRNSEDVEYIPGLEGKNNPRSPKSTRLESMEIDFAKGKVYLKPDMAELRDELVLYPRAAHDDLLDGLYYAKRKIWVPSHAAVTEEKKEDEYKFNRATSSSWLTA